MIMAKMRNMISELNFLFKDLTPHISTIQGLSKDQLVEYHSQLFQYPLAFTSKLANLAIMYHYTVDRCKQLPKTIEEEKKKHIVLTKTTFNMNETEAFFEAYLNAFYSFLQVIAKITPFFYKKEFPELKIADKDFGSQVDFIKNRKKLPDEIFSKYVEKDLYPWYKILKDFRHAITHRDAIFVGFEPDGTVVFLEPPKEEETRYWLKKNKPYVKMENYVNDSFNNLLDFMDFYTNHFRLKIEMSEHTKLMKKLFLKASN